ncbi:hypothetical protein V5O48_004377 [Marasmius crinis-equi]|uniref:Ubiquitin-like domain-containing protein n=1 Tax=Marasmius crinis-equi TaxID=585013 RepID=A0ABR3FQA1_9AGAR
MPKTARKVTSSSRSSTLLILERLHSSERPKIVSRPNTYQTAIHLIREYFKIRSGYSITLQTDELDICGGETMDITDCVWDSVKDEITRLYFEEIPNREAEELDMHEVGRILASHRIERFGYQHMASSSQHTALIPKNKSAEVDEERLWLHVEDSSGMYMSFGAKRSATGKTLTYAISLCTGRDLYKMRLQYDGCHVFDEDTLASLDVEDQVTFYSYVAQLGGKPVIYLFSPQEIEAKFALASHPTIYPVVPFKRTIGEKVHQAIEWTAQTRLDGSLVETTTGLEVAYMFWEAHTCGALSPSTSPTLKTIAEPENETFVPTNAQITPQNSVLVSIGDLPGYLDRALKALSLHTEARTSFITYWLPSLLRHKLVALRFIPQSAYEEAAPLDITPAPDAVTRVFMLFRDVPEAQLKRHEEDRPRDDKHEWQEAVKRASEDVVFWQTIVGVEMTKCMDSSLFRVLEWGGMEVF